MVPPAWHSTCGCSIPFWSRIEAWTRTIASPRMAIACQVAMNLTMGYMLIVMIHLA